MATKKNSTSLTVINRKIKRIEDAVKTAELVTNKNIIIAKRLDDARDDGWYNSLVGLGKALDKSNKTYFGDFHFMDRNQLSRMYVGDGLGRKIVDCVADDMTRKWIELKMEDPSQQKLMEETIKKLKVPVYFNEALKWERLFGGSVIVMGAYDGLPLDYPLLLNKVHSMEWLKVVDCWDVDLPSSEWDRDPASPTYGQVIRYMCQFRVSGTGRIDRLLVHNSRVLPFYGENIPKSLVMGDQRTRYWGASILQAVWDDVANLGGVKQTLVNIFYEFMIGKYKLSNLAEMLEAGNEAKLNNRMTGIQMSKSVINAVLLGADEEYTRDSANVSGLADLVDRFMMFVSGVVSIPVTRLFGRSAAGMNSTGDEDLATYYDNVGGKQKTDLEPNLTKFLLILSQIYKFDGIPSYEFNELKQATSKESAEVEKLKADTYAANANADQIYLMNQVASPEEIALKREFITEEEYNLLRGELPTDEPSENAEEEIKSKPGEGSKIGTPMKEKNLIDIPKNAAKSEKSALSNATQRAVKQPTSAVPPQDNPGSQVY